MDRVFTDPTGRIAAAPFEPESWPSVLEDMADALGGWGGQLVAGAQGKVAFCLADRNISDDRSTPSCACAGNLNCSIACAI
ncbi:MAG: hypothetical protein ABUL73_00175 [Alphaproteobacteria bacterium]